MAVPDEKTELEIYETFLFGPLRLQLHEPISKPELKAFMIKVPL